MSWHWKELLPVDSFSVRLADLITDLDFQVLTLLYQPLIGVHAIALYKSLVMQLPYGDYHGETHTHQHLSLMTGQDIAELLEARKKLEAIDLLKTYQKKTEQDRLFVYELQPPMKPNVFFQDDVLSVFLYNRLGKQGYRIVKDRFLVQRMDYSDFEELTQSFSDVFTSLTHSEMQPKLMGHGDTVFNGSDEYELIGKEKTGLKIKGFDIELMMQSLSSFIVPNDLLTDEMKELIKKLAFVYQIEPLPMANLVERATFDHSLTAHKLRETVQAWYKLETSTQAPALGYQTQPVRERTVKGEPQTEEERVVAFYEETSPASLLEMRQEGAVVAPSDLKIIEELILDYLLNPGVVNVMIDSILFRNDMKISRALMLKIAAHWKRKKIKTVPAAMQLIKEEKQKQAEVKTKQTGKRNTRQDKLPKWLVQEQNGQTPSEQKKKDRVKENDVLAAQQEIASLMEERNRRRAKKGGE
ncbi:replication initiation and membrane attachment protein [Alkalihalobacillus xiaoxiensis]|uniref:Replication initiation and membrane attachment protein n=1 Tax=Shouchella xiaoxiensis TaxID=766895 RepID=A0ABS2STH1_9BACI|nr:DnaD domain protein [Shouchella xiaoxiensis]MBM7838486.1 replication initiation and membrane attachment protein [Shouchella xiaoxiensis]